MHGYMHICTHKLLPTLPLSLLDTFYVTDAVFCKD